jgi:hypothetical protein
MIDGALHGEGGQTGRYLQHPPELAAGWFAVRRCAPDPDPPTAPSAINRFLTSVAMVMKAFSTLISCFAEVSKK